VAVTNGGSIRGDKIYPPGRQSRGGRFSAELPFRQRLVTIDVRAAPQWPRSKTAFSRLPAPSGRFPQVAGLKIEADPSRPAGTACLSIKVGDTPLDANKTYSVATSDFMGARRRRLRRLPRCKPVLPPPTRRVGL